MKKVLISKIITAVLTTVLLTSCILSPDFLSKEYSKNPFLDGIIIDTTLDEINFALFTDVHVNRELYDKNSYHEYDALYSFLTEKNFDFAVSLGDLSHDGKQADNVFEFVENVKSKTKNNLLIQCVGNHDRKGSNPYAYVLEAEHKSMCRYIYGNLSIYVLDNSTRTFSNKQLNWLTEALEKDTSKYKIFLAHENITAGGYVSNTLFIFGLSDVNEMNYLFYLMDKYNVGLIFTGHSHSGGQIYTSPNNNYSEFNCGSFVKGGDLFEPGLNYYDVNINQTNGKVTVNAYKAYLEEIDYSLTFTLPAFN